MRRACLLGMSVSVLLLMVGSSQVRADEWKCRLTIDNVGRVYFGDAIGMNLAPVCDTKYWTSTTDFWITPLGHDEYLYVATASDQSVAQGFIGTFTNMTLGRTANTGDAAWQVFAAGPYLAQLGVDPAWIPWPPSPSASYLPTHAQVKAAIAFATTNDLWVTPATFPGYDNDPSTTPAATFPWTAAFPLPNIPAEASWIWYQSATTTSGAIASPFAGFNHDEFLVFRFPRNACIQPPDSMVGWWPFDEDSGPSAEDVAGPFNPFAPFNNVGTHQNGPTPVPWGRVDWALDFDGVDEYVCVPDQSELYHDYDNFSIDAWINVSPAGLVGTRPIVDKRSYDPVGYMLFLKAGLLGLQMAGGGTSQEYSVGPSYQITPNEWHHVAASVNRHDLPHQGTLYVDGESVVTFAPLSGNLDNNADLWIGRHHPNSIDGNDHYWIGAIDELEMFSSPLTDDEVELIYSAANGKCKPRGGILVCKFSDLDKDGVWDPNEPGLPGVTIQVNGLSCITGPDGCCQFENLLIGQYTISEVVPTGYYQTAPYTVVHTVDVQPNMTMIGKNFGNALKETTGAGGDITCFAGDRDQFAHDGDCAELAFPGPELQAVLDTCSGGPNHCTCPDGPEFDCPAVDQCFGHTFSQFLAPNCHVCGARILGRLRATGSGSPADILHFMQDGISVWSISLDNLSDIANGDPTWDPGDTLSFDLDLTALPPSGSGPSNVLVALQDGDLDVLIQDDTEVDYLELIVTTCSISGAPCCLNDLWLDTVRTLSSRDVEVALKRNGVVPMGGFNFLITYDPTVLSFLGAAQGALLDSLEWEYFTYRTGDCHGGCPDGLVRLIAMADLDNGPDLHPTVSSAPGILANLRFRVSGDRNLIGQCAPIRFYWADCGDNTVASVSGDTTYVDRSIYDGSWGLLWAEDDDDQFPEDARPQGVGAPDVCVEGGGTDKPAPTRGLCFRHGWVCIDEPPDDRGDLNLNGFAYDVGDAVLLIDYFIYGESVWDPVYRDAQVLASDVNDDGVVLTVADLVYLIRVITGDAEPFPAGGNPRLSSSANSVTVSYRTEDGTIRLSTTSSVAVGGGLFVLRYSGMATGTPVLSAAASDLKIKSSAAEGVLRVIVYPDMANPASISAGANEIVSIPTVGEGTVELVEVQLSDASGAALSASAAAVGLPTEYALLQNYPNPFNSGTVMPFALKDATEWTLTVYNVVGQVVRRFHGRDGAGAVRVSWDGTADNGRSVPSGIYFYRLTTPEWTASRKMTLVK